jgi:hypothetical protein
MRRTRKNRKYNACIKDAKKGTSLKCKMKTARAKMYQAIYGKGGSNWGPRSPLSVYY